MARDPYGDFVGKSLKNSGLRTEIMEFKEKQIIPKIITLMKLREDGGEKNTVKLDFFKNQLSNFENDPFNRLYSRPENILDLSSIMRAPRIVARDYEMLLKALNRDLIVYHNKVRALRASAN